MGHSRVALLSILFGGIPKCLPFGIYYLSLIHLMPGRDREAELT